VIPRADGHRCRAEGGVLPVPWPIACMAAVIHVRRRPERNVDQAGRDERTRLRFSRISIARCADVIRSSASAWGPLSQSVHRVTGARATDQRPCAQDLRPGGTCYGRIPGAGDGGRERARSSQTWPMAPGPPALRVVPRERGLAGLRRHQPLPAARRRVPGQPHVRQSQRRHAAARPHQRRRPHRPPRPRPHHRAPPATGTARPDG
jgi:hypothetical protein